MPRRAIHDYDGVERLWPSDQKTEELSSYIWTGAIRYKGE